jgi:hypothetical protein
MVTLDHGERGVIVANVLDHILPPSPGGGCDRGGWRAVPGQESRANHRPEGKDE